MDLDQDGSAEVDYGDDSRSTGLHVGSHETPGLGCSSEVYAYLGNEVHDDLDVGDDGDGDDKSIPLLKVRVYLFI